MTPPAPPDSLEHHYADINGIRMHYAAAGTGETVLFLHGFPEFWYSWRHQMAALAPHYHVVAPDLRGYNKTENSGPYDVKTLREDVLALIRHLGAGSVHLVGHDWGGAMSWLVAMYNPEALKTLTVMNLPHPVLFQQGIKRPRQILRSLYIPFFQLPWLPERALALRNYRFLARAIIRDCQPGTFTRQEIKRYLESWRRQGLNGGLNWYRALVRNHRALNVPVPIIETPTLLIWGERDFALGKELTYGTDAYVANLQLEYLPDASHWVQQDAPETVNKLLFDHLGQNAAASRA